MKPTLTPEEAELEASYKDKFAALVAANGGDKFSLPRDAVAALQEEHRQNWKALIGKRNYYEAARDRAARAAERAVTTAERMRDHVIAKRPASTPTVTPKVKAAPQPTVFDDADETAAALAAFTGHKTPAKW